MAMVSWFSVFSDVGKLKCFKRVIPDTSWKCLGGPEGRRAENIILNRDFIS